MKSISSASPREFIRESLARNAREYLLRSLPEVDSPDSWQLEFLRSVPKRGLLLCARQVGKSTLCAAVALSAALRNPRRPVLITSYSQGQSILLLKRVLKFVRHIQLPLAYEAETRLELLNGARIYALSGSPESIRGYDRPSAIVIDEAAFVSDELYLAVAPIAVDDTLFLQATTPFGKRGQFYQKWAESDDWAKIKVTAADCPRRWTPEAIERERRDPTVGDRGVRQELYCEFLETQDSVFRVDQISAAVDAGVEAWEI